MVKLPKLATAVILVGALASVAATEASAAPVNGLALTTASPILATEIQYRPRYDGAYVYWGYPSRSYWGYPRSSYWGYPAYRTYWGGYPAYGYVY
jgi:hypothetical protein